MVTEFLYSVDRRPGLFCAVARSLGQDWPQATGECVAHNSTGPTTASDLY
jgi:hypothetical protein